MTTKDLRTNAIGQQRKWSVLVAIGISSFMTALDGSVVNTVLPVLRADFNSTVAAIEWVIVIYLLLVSGLLLTFGRLGDMRGHKPVYLTGFGLFVASSALCGLAPSTGALIGFRGLQALGAAMVMSNSPAILTKNFPAGQRGQALGMQATLTYLGLTAGPSLGGWLTQHLSWRAAFYINVPVGILAIALGTIFIPSDRDIQKNERFDLAGALLFMAGLVALLLGLNQGHAWGWTSPAILGLLAGSILMLIFFVRIERRQSNPMLDLSLFDNRIFSISVASAVINYICVNSILFLMPFYLIQGRGLNPAEAGLLLTSLPVIMAVTAPLSGTLSDRIGARLPAMLGMLVLAAGLFLLSRLSPQAPRNWVSLALAVSGLGTGIFISPNTSALLGAAPPHRRGIASGIMATSRNVGMVLGIGMAGAVLTTFFSPAESATVYIGVSHGFTAAMIAALVGTALSLVRGAENRPTPGAAADEPVSGGTFTAD